MKQKTIAAADAHRNYKSSKDIGNILLFIVVGLLTITPFFRGLFFRENYLPAAAFIGAASVLLIVKQLKEKTSFIQSYMDFAFIGLIFSYFVSFIFGISKSGALDGVLKYFAAFLVYKIAFELTKDSRIKEYLLDGIVFSGFITALFSLLGSGGIVNIPGVFGWGERLNGPYQYPNATASILGGIFMLNLFLLMNKKNIYLRVAYFLSASILMLTFLETRSRGAMLTLLAAWIFAFLLSKAKDKLALIIYTAASGATSLIFYSKIYSTIIEKKNFLLMFMVFIVVSIVFGALMEFLNKKLVHLEAKHTNRILAVILIALAMAGTAALNLTTSLKLSEALPQRGYEIYQVKPSTAYKLEFEAESLNTEAAKLNVKVNSVNRAKERTALFNDGFAVGPKNINSIEFTTDENTYFVTVDFANATLDKSMSINNCIISNGESGVVVEKLKLNYRFIPNDIAKKINEISLKTESSSERLVFVKDGMKMFKDYFLTGTGARGWGLLYTKYQSYGYVSSEAHNYYLQTAIESGVLGVLSLVGILVFILLMGIKLYLKNCENPYMLIGLLSMLFELLSHALLDFDFSLFTIFMVLVTGIGWLGSIAAQNEILSIKVDRGRVLTSVLALSLSIVLVLSTTVIYAGKREGGIAASLVGTDMSKAQKVYESAMKKDFYNSSILVDYNQILTVEAKKNKDKAIADQIYKNYKIVEENDPYEAKYYGVMVNFYLSFGYLDDALALSERLIDVQPFKPQSYEMKADLCYQVIRYYFDKKDYETALKYNALILDIERQHEEANKRIIAPFELSEKTKKLIEASKTDKVNMEGLVK